MPRRPHAAILASRVTRGVAAVLIAFSPLPARATLVAHHEPPLGEMEFLSRAQAETAATGVFHGVGVVTAIDATSGALTLDHEDIKGFMPAMEMMYRVKSRDLARGLHVGDKVGFEIDAKSYTILSVTLLSPAKQ